ncbi:hypothetical protein [Nocardia harenae]|nr:hypothetical protein [Nocardia harenae]
MSKLLIEVARRLKRVRALNGLVGMAEQGDFDVLLDKREYRR